jgi:hypothetical protein
MPQSVYIDENNNVRIREAGPVGPAGFGGAVDDTPVEMLGVAQSRSLPWTGWTQFNGVPLYTYAMDEHRFTIGFSTTEMTLLSYTDQGYGPLLLGDGVAKNIAMMALLVPLREEVTEIPEAVASARIKVIGVAHSATDGTAMIELIDEPIYALSPGEGSPSAEMMVEIAESATYETSITLPEGKRIIGLRLMIVNEDGTPFEESTWNVAVVRTSIWEGESGIVPRLDLASPYTLSGLTTPQFNAIKMVRGGEDIVSMITPNGMHWGHFKVEDAGFIQDGLADLRAITVEMDEAEGETTKLFLQASRLRVSAEPVGPLDVVRFGDLPEGTGGAAYVAPSYDAYSAFTMEPGQVPHIWADMTEDMNVSFLNNGLTRAVVMIARGGTEAKSLTLVGSESSGTSITIHPGDVYYFSILARPPAPPEDHHPDLSVLEIAYRRIVSAPAVTGPLPYAHAQRPPVDNELPIDSLTTEVEADDQVMHVPNPGVGRWVTLRLRVFNNTGSTKSLNFDCTANHFPPSLGVPDGYDDNFWLVVMGGESAPTIDAVLD